MITTITASKFHMQYHKTVIFTVKSKSIGPYFVMRVKLFYNKVNLIFWSTQKKILAADYVY